ncbi:MAG: hypothetical protein ABR564_04770 [Candidatus Dormibacteria bacterium]
MRSRDVAIFTVMVALLGIFFDASVGHALTWENDPYWTYWITKTFLIATVFGLGTAWLGMGAGRGAVLTVVHTLILTVYYWTLAPIGTPSSPNWLDLEHTWVTGSVIHFGVIYLGYLTALWLWRRRERRAPEFGDDTGPLALRALISALVIVLLAGGLTGLALDEFPGVTWFVVRLLLTATFLLLWWGLVGRTGRITALAGAVLLALMWGAYSRFLGPVGLPAAPLRILGEAPPPPTSHWLGYVQLFGVSLPIWVTVMAAAMLLTSETTNESRWPAAAAALAGAVVVVIVAVATRPFPLGTPASVSSSGVVNMETGDFFSNNFQAGDGDMQIRATDMGDQVTPLPPHDRLSVRAHVTSGGHTYDLDVADPWSRIPTDPTPPGGVSASTSGTTGIAASALPSCRPSTPSWQPSGWAGSQSTAAMRGETCRCT